MPDTFLSDELIARGLIDRRPTRPNSIAITGTSRHASMWLDGGSNRRNKWNANFLNWARCFLRAQGKPLDVLLNNAVSGNRTDQFDVAGAIAAGARFVMLDGAINDIGRATPAIFSGSISGTTMSATISTFNGIVGIGGVVTGTGVAAGTTILRQIGADSGGVRQFEVSVSQTVSSTTLTSTGYTVLTGPQAGTYVTFSNVAAVAAEVIISAINAINLGGSIAIYVVERGASGWSRTHQSILNDYNAIVASYLERGDATRPVPNAIIFDPTPYCQNMAVDTIVLTGTVDGVHDGSQGSRRIGQGLAKVLAPYLREVTGHGFRVPSQYVGVSGQKRGLISNVLMNGSVAVSSPHTGNIPTGFTLGTASNCSADFQIAAMAVDTEANSLGNELTITITATAAGQFNLYQALYRTEIKAGDKIRGGMEIDVAAGATGVRNVAARLDWYPSSGGSLPMWDMIGSSFYGNDPGGYERLSLEPDALEILPGFTGQPFTNLNLTVDFNSAGSVVIKTRKWWAERN